MSKELLLFLVLELCLLYALFVCAAFTYADDNVTTDNLSWQYLGNWGISNNPLIYMDDNTLHIQVHGVSDHTCHRYCLGEYCVVVCY
jgi:hypothetical protein